MNAAGARVPAAFFPGSAQNLRQAVEDHRPALAGAVLPIGPDAFVAQRQPRAVAVRLDGDDDPGRRRLEAGAEVEDEPARPLNLDIGAPVPRDFLAAALVDLEAAADARVDLDPLHHAVGSREQP